MTDDLRAALEATPPGALTLLAPHQNESLF